jgi:VanZ family protein
LEDRQPNHLALPIPLVALVLAFTAIPTELRPFTLHDLARFLRYDSDLTDMVVNVLGYVPLGIVFAARRGMWATTATAALVSLVAETSQVIARGRSPSLTDATMNTLGAAIGWMISAAWAIQADRIAITRRRAWAALAMAVACVASIGRVTPRDVGYAVTAFVEAPAWLPVNDRSGAGRGRLEARWTFETIDNRTVIDASGNGVNGTVVNGADIVEGIDGRAIRLNGANQYVDFHDNAALRITGSMTIGAWINASAFPLDDAAVVSSLRKTGYQLDTTVDQGPRTIGFKLTGSTGRPMMRYGRTPLRLNRWYHVAGVYDAQAQLLHVYLDGRLDDGCLVGTITNRQHVSGTDLVVGRRSGSAGFEFAGAIDDVRMYSRALAQRELVDIVADRPRHLPAADDVESREPSGDAACVARPSTDGRISGVVLSIGMLIAVAAVGLWPASNSGATALILSGMSAVAMIPLIRAAVPDGYRWMVPLLTLAGTAVVITSANQRNSLKGS